MALTGLSLAQVLATIAAFGAAVTVLYLLKLRRRPIEVPFVHLWQQILAEERTTRLFSTLRRLFSLLLALAFVALLGIALGDPRLEAALDRGRTVVLLLDVSASMGATDIGRSRLEAAREEARRHIDALGPNDRMLIAALGEAAIPLTPITGDAEVLARALENLALLDVAADWDVGLRFALDALHATPNAEVVVIGDGRMRPPSPALETRAREGGVSVRWIRIGRGGPNVAITAFAVRRYPIDKSRAQVLVELWNPGERAEDVTLTLFGDGDPLDVSSFRIDAGERLPRIFEGISGADRTLEARVHLAGGAVDALAADDRSYATLPERRRARVLVVAEDDIYLEAALLLDEYLEVVTVAPAAFPPPGTFDVAIFESFVPGARYDADTVYIHPLPPSGVEGPFPVLGTIERPFFDRMERDHPLLRFTSLRDVNIAEALHVQALPGDRVVGADARGPLLITGVRGDRRIVALAFDPRRSDLPLRIAWPLLLLNAIDFLVEEQAGYLSSYRTGETWYVPVETGATRASLIDPDGVERTVPIDDGRAICTGSHAGFYTLRTEGAERVLAANLGPGDEAILLPADALPGAGAPSTSPARGPLAPHALPWTWLVLAAFALITVEWVTFHRRWTV